MEPSDDMDAAFYITHADLSPTNIILSGTAVPKSEDGASYVHIAAIVDWESAAFYPRFWIALYLVHPLGAHWLTLGDEQYRENVNLATQYAVIISRVLTGFRWPVCRDLFL